MKKKESLLAKLNIKDYTNRLEKILEEKEFSVDTKNLLLSMLYKIENAYSDYAKTKVTVPRKNDFIEEILDIIKEDCQKIVVAEFNSKAGQVLSERGVKYIVEKDKGKITAFGNELLLFDCILKMKEHEICIPQEKIALQKAISDLLNLGSRINKLEVIRDFNGWSWDVVTQEIEDINANLIFQNLIYIVGVEFIKEWIANKSELADYIELMYMNLKENYGEKRAEKFIKLFCKLSIDNSILNSNYQCEYWKEKREEYRTEFNKLQDKEKFLESKTKEKKEYSKKIKEIDKILNNKELLENEYTSRNEKLPNKEKIFSISHLADRLEKEREEFLEKIKACNELIEPKGYVLRKQEVEKRLDFLEKLDIEQNKDEKIEIIKLCETFLECFKIKVAKIKTKQEVINCIYILRYYGFLPLQNNGIILKNVKELKQIFEKVKKDLLEKARKLDVIDEVTEDTVINEEIIENIFDSKMIDLNHMVIETKVEDGKLYVEYYDERILETTVQVESDKTIRLKKRTKLFI